MNVNQVLVDRLATELLQRHACVTTAESCTGGWLAKNLTDLPGSSAWFEYGVVSYSDAAKVALLNVDPALLEEHGAVSSAVAAAMVSGVLELSGALLGVAVTGIAGPDGGTADKPVGTVWFGYGAKDQKVETECLHFDGDRDTVRRQTVSAALSGLLKYLDNSNV